MKQTRLIKQADYLETFVELWAKEPHVESQFSPTRINITHIVYIRIVESNPSNYLSISFVNGVQLLALYDEITLRALSIKEDSAIYSECPAVKKSMRTRKENIEEIDKEIEQLTKRLDFYNLLRIGYEE